MIAAAAMNGSGRYRHWYRADDFLQYGTEERAGRLTDSDRQDLFAMAFSTEPTRSVRA